MNAEKSQSAILDGLLAQLISDEPDQRLTAIRALAALDYSSVAILRRLENISLNDPQPEVRQSASALLDSAAYGKIQSRLSRLTPTQRALFREEIDSWVRQGLLEEPHAEVILRRYDFDTSGRNAPRPQAQAPGVAPAPAAPAQSAAPRPSLLQTLTSETSIKIWLYLGAFFVIASALILAALVEFLRLSILLVVTALFGVGALALKKRLPQPSFTLWIVASTLGLISAAVLYDTLSLPAPWREIYWSSALLVTALVWAFSTWLYRSRFFSLAAFISLAAASLSFADIFNTSDIPYLTCLAAAGVIGIAGSAALKRWQTQRFALPLFILLHIMGIILVAIGGFGTFASTFDQTALTGSDWLWMALFWLLMAAFYALGDQVIPFALFPFLSAAALTPLSWLALNWGFAILSLDSPPRWGFAAGWWGWALLLALLGEIASILGSEKIKRYALPLTLFSLPLFFVGSLWDFDNATLVFALSLTSAITLTALNTRRARWWVWATGIAAYLLGYFTFFGLAFITFEPEALYLLTGAVALLLIPDLIPRPDLHHAPAWRVPLRIYTVLFTLLAILVGLFEGYDTPLMRIIAFSVLAVLWLAASLRFRQPLMGYSFTLFATLGVTFAIQTYAAVDWLPAITSLSAVYYATGFVLGRRTRGRGWSDTLRWSGLALGGILATFAFSYQGAGAGWYVAIIGFLFIIETFARLNWLELVVYAFFMLAYALLMTENKTDWRYTLMGLAIIPLAFDCLVGRLADFKRPWRVLVWAAGGFFSLVATISTFSAPDLEATLIVVSFALLFLALALLNRQPRLGYIYFTYLSLTLLFALRTSGSDRWLFPMIGLAMIIYALSWFDKPAGWGTIRRTSGLALATLTALSAPFENSGLAASIPVAIAATFWAVEAFRRRNVWLGFPANALYLMAYFIILLELNVDQPQFFSVGAAALGMLMHYLLMRSGSNLGAFVTGMASQLVLLSATYIQMVSTNSLGYFAALFFQSLVVLAYGLIIRSRSLVFTPIFFVVLGVVTVVFSVLKGIATVILIGCTGILFILLGIVAVLMRERITELRDRLSDWRA